MVVQTQIQILELEQLAEMVTAGMDYVQIRVNVAVNMVIVELHLPTAIMESIIMMVFLLHLIQTQTLHLEELVTMA